MSSLRFYAIGAIVQYKGVSLVVVAQDGNMPSCAGCYFGKVQQAKRHDHISCYRHIIACTAHIRRDKKHIILVKR